MTDRNVTPATDEQAANGAPNTMVHDRVLCAHSQCTPCYVASLRARIAADAKVIEELRAVAERLARAAGVPADAVKVK